MCGGPRIPENRGGEPAAFALKDQKQHLDAARSASIATIVQGTFGVLATLVAIIASPSTLVAKAILFAAALAPLLLAIRSQRGATKARATAAEAGERAWLAAAEEIAQGGTTAKDVAKKLRIDVPRAERLLAAGAAQSRVRIDVDDESADVVYRTEEGLSTDEYPALKEQSK